MSAERDAALRYIRRVLGMQSSIRAQLELREQQVEILTAEVEELRARLAAALAECDRAAARPGADGERKVHTVVIRQAAQAAPGDPAEWDDRR